MPVMLDGADTYSVKVQIIENESLVGRCKDTNFNIIKTFLGTKSYLKRG